MRGIHWFRNDLRLRDNTALRLAAARATELMPLFILDPALLDRHRSGARRAYLVAALASLGSDLRGAGCPLTVAIGDPAVVIPRIATATGARLLTFNRDYSPYATRRDRQVTEAFSRAGGSVETAADRVIFEAGEIRTQNGSAFQVYTPYRRAWLSKWQRAPQRPTAIPRLPKPFLLGDTQLSKAALGAARGKATLGDTQRSNTLEMLNGDVLVDVLVDTQSPAGALAGILSVSPPADFPDTQPGDTFRDTHLPAPTFAGEAAATARLDEFLAGPVIDYAEARDRPALDGTSRLSPALRMGVISARTCISRALDARRDQPIRATGVARWIDELIWRDFYQALLAEHPRVLRESFRPEYREIEWNNDRVAFAAWCRGETGFPFVDAAMRQLNGTGWMHNRARMVVASFLVKDLLIDWRWGERYFLDHLFDGDPAANNGGWQWAASTGTDAQPYFRIFNPVAQGRRFDPDGVFVRKYLPELADVATRHIHEPWNSPHPPADYPRPIVDHAERRIAAITRFAAARDRSKRRST